MDEERILTCEVVFCVSFTIDHLLNSAPVLHERQRINRGGLGYTCASNGRRRLSAGARLQAYEVMRSQPWRTAAFMFSQVEFGLRDSQSLRSEPSTSFHGRPRYVSLRAIEVP